MLQGRRSFVGAAAASLLLPSLARAQEGQMRIVVPFAAGSGTDVTARVIAEAIGKNTGRVVIVENRGGAGGSLGAAEVARAKPDGNTVLYTTGGFTTNAALFKSLPFDPIADFTPITMLSRSSGFVLLVSEKSPFKTLEQFVAAAKKEPGRLTYGSSGLICTSARPSTTTSKVHLPLPLLLPDIFAVMYCGWLLPLPQRPLLLLFQPELLLPFQPLLFPQPELLFQPPLPLLPLLPQYPLSRSPSWWP